MPSVLKRLNVVFEHPVPLPENISLTSPFSEGIEYLRKAYAILVVLIKYLIHKVCSV